MFRPLWQSSLGKYASLVVLIGGQRLIHFARRIVACPGVVNHLPPWAELAGAPGGDR